MENSKREWDEFVAREYAYLVKVARRFSVDAKDLVSHTYLRCCDKKFPNSPLGYFCTAMYMEATRGQFKKIYRLEDRPPAPDVAVETDLQTALRREQVELFIDRLQWFDRQIVRLYLDGHNLAEVAREAGINPATIYQSLHRTKKVIADAIRNARAKGRTATDL